MWIPLFLLASAAHAQTLPALLPFETDYLKAMHILKSPPVAGVLVADLAKGGAGAAAGIQMGDIITIYNGSEVDTVGSLKKAMADALAAQLAAKVVAPVNLMVLRDGKNVQLKVDRGGLELTPVEVRAGVASKLNPPPSAKSDLALAWTELAKGSPRDVWMVFRAADGTPQSITQMVLTRQTDAWQSQVNVFTRENPNQPSLHMVTRFGGSDGIELPVFLLDTLSCDSPLRQLEVQRLGNRLVGAKDPVPTLMNAIPLECAIETVAAAMPHAADKVLGFAGIDPHTLQTRLGYVLATTGQQKVQVAKQEQSFWGVQEMRFGRVELTWWFDDQRNLVLIEGPDLRAERAATEEAARAILQPKP